ncbi:hypothetical protein L1987_18436 [Smallanthus sonchifolius]|uniref:Uncharacterized protein n=1 Tax=Smallanthus sonchifolius TaxID=185202 RepID=A0ACB9J0A8_9ASTR|nr:hypothetical protein L1987_18436 [Smallanthus sonchifolius]
MSMKHLVNVFEVFLPQLLLYQNTSDPLNGDVAALMMHVLTSYEQKVKVSTASGLSYLPEACQRRIIHRDIKEANILLSEDFEPKISDFEFAKWLPDHWLNLTVSQFEGIFGYICE